MSERLAPQLFRAVGARFEAQRQEAIATVALYLESGVGVGDHPNIVDEICAAVTRLAAAEEALVSLERNFIKRDEEAPTEGEQSQASPQQSR
jgi:ABC-type transport system involved in cytochrome c biogenesis permease component